MDRHEILTQLDSIVEWIAAAPLRREAQAFAHKVRYPMADILAKVPGDTLTDRAKRLNVSRQTMYVWASERFRPTKAQAKRISKYTDVPIAHILGNGFEIDAAPKRARRSRPRRLKASG